MVGKVINPPWTVEQVQNLNEYQQSGMFHPYTCGTDTCRADLIAEESGWRCPECGYTQNWCLSFMADGAWRKLKEALYGTDIR